MPGKKFNELRARMSPKARAQSEAITAKHLEKMRSKERRQASKSPDKGRTA